MRECFLNRTEAGQFLADKLLHYANQPNTLVLGLPRGGVPVAFEVARALHAPLDVFVVRKLGTPGNPELAMGAIAEGGFRTLNNQVIESLDIPGEVIDSVTATEEKEIKRRVLAYRGSGAKPMLKGKTVILVDDGVATGSSMKAAIRAIQAEYPARLVVGVPTAARSTYHEVRPRVDEMVALMTPDRFIAVGEWYVNFPQTSDEEVTQLLASARRHQETAAV
jgi:putative phosphoribosyl transferase